MRTFLLLLFGAVAAAMVLLALGALARAAPGAPVIAVGIGILVLVIGLRVFRRLGRAEAPEEFPPEDVGELDVFFVCGECGTEFRVEKIGELQVPRHCGEKMHVERRPRALPGLN